MTFFASCSALANRFPILDRVVVSFGFISSAALVSSFFLTGNHWVWGLAGVVLLSLQLVLHFGLRSEGSRQLASRGGLPMKTNQSAPWVSFLFAFAVGALAGIALAWTGPIATRDSVIERYEIDLQKMAAELEAARQGLAEKANH